MQKAYGRQIGDLETMTRAFGQILGPYPLASVQAAFLQFIRRNPTIPAPSDIIAILDPLPPTLDAAYYRTLKKTTYKTPAEHKYIETYEQIQNQMAATWQETAQGAAKRH